MLLPPAAYCKVMGLIWQTAWQDLGPCVHILRLAAANAALHLSTSVSALLDLPEISVSHVNLTVREGENAVITCNGSGSPLPDVDWTVADLHSINTHQVGALLLGRGTAAGVGSPRPCVQGRAQVDVGECNGKCGMAPSKGKWGCTLSR